MPYLRNFLWPNTWPRTNVKPIITWRNLCNCIYHVESLRVCQRCEVSIHAQAFRRIIPQPTMSLVPPDPSQNFAHILRYVLQCVLVPYMRTNTFTVCSTRTLMASARFSTPWRRSRVLVAAMPTLCARRLTLTSASGMYEHMSRKMILCCHKCNALSFLGCKNEHALTPQQRRWAQLGWTGTYCQYPPVASGVQDPYVVP